MLQTQQEIMEKGYQALINSLGVVDTIRFIQYFNPGKGNYTEERYQWLENKSVEDVFQEIEQFREDDLSHYEEIIE